MSALERIAGNSVVEPITRPLTEVDRPVFERFCARYPLRLLTPRMHLDQYGLGSVVLPNWGAFDSTGAMHGVMFRINTTMIVADGNGSCATSFAPIIDRQPGLSGVRGTRELLTGLQGILRSHQCTHREESPFMRLLTPVVPYQSTPPPRPATLDDLDALALLYSAAGTMYRTRQSVLDKLSRERVYLIETRHQDGSMRAASCALTNIQSATVGLIGGVYTANWARGRGYAAAVTGALSAELQSNGKMPCLFYENPVAGRVYSRLGFVESGRWAVMYIAPR